MAIDINQELMEHARKQAERPVYVFSVPPDLTNEIGCEKMGFVKILGNEVNSASQRCRNDAVRLSFELALESLCKIDDKRVSLADGSADRAWSRMGMKGWQMAIAAYGKVNNPTEAQMTDFLSGMVVEAG